MARPTPNGQPFRRRYTMRTVLIASLIVCGGPVAESVETTIVDFEVSEGTNLAFDIAPDGETIVFDLLGQLWVLPFEGGEARPLTDAVRDTAEDVDPSFSPDGRWVVFEADRPGGTGLWLVPAEGGEPRRITPEGLYVDQYTDLQPAWTPDSRQVAYALGGTVYRIEVATGDLSKVPIDPSAGTLLSRLGSPAFSPDGKRLAIGTGADRAFRLSVPAGARLWETQLDGGGVRPLTPDGLQAVSPAYSPDGASLAFFAPDSLKRWQLWIRSGDETKARPLTGHEDMATRRVRWTPDGRGLVYSADGRLWRIGLNGEGPREIPFSARIHLERPTYRRVATRFAEPGSERPARGFYGLALSPEGTRIAMLALGKLWIWPVDGSPRAVADVPDGAYHLSWSGTGAEVVFSTGDLHAADAETGELRRLTALPGHEGFPVWSPDGRYVAFLHWGPDVPREARNHARLVRADAGTVGDLAQTIDLGPAQRGYWGRDQPTWSPGSEGVLLYAVDGEGRTAARLALLDGTAQAAADLPPSASFVSWPVSDSIVYVHGVRLWSAGYDPESGGRGAPTPLSDEPALYASAARTGAALYVSDDGLRLRTPTGEVKRLGWPISFMTPPAPAPVLIRNVHLIDGTGAPVSPSRDLLLEAGRIARIAPAGSLDAPDGANVLDGEERFVIPGLIDLHQHIWKPHPPLEGGLYHGVTSIRDVGSSIAWSAAHGDIVNAGLRPGPRIALGGSFLLSGAGLSKDAGLFVSDSGQAARAVSLLKGFGATTIKHYLDGWAGLTTIIAEAHRQALPVTGHCASLLPLVAAGMDGQEHTGACVRDNGRIYDDYARIKAEAGIWVAPDVGFNLLFQQLLQDPEVFDRHDIHPFLGEWGLPVYDPERMGPARQSMYERGRIRQRARTARLWNAGVVLATGTDQWFPTAVHSEIEGLVLAGVPPAEAIAAATSVAARVLGAESEIGTIEPGKLADLVILDANPLEDISNVRHVWQVIQGGRIVDRDALLEFVRASPALASGPDYGY